MVKKLAMDQPATALATEAMQLMGLMEVIRPHRPTAQKSRNHGLNVGLNVGLKDRPHVQNAVQRVKKRAPNVGLQDVPPETETNSAQAGFSRDLRAAFTGPFRG